MEFEIKIVRGPLAQGFTREAAAEKLQALPGFPENATYEIEEVDGRYVAAVVIPKVAGPFPPAPDDAPSGPPADDGAGADSSDGEDKNPFEKKEDDKGDEDKGDSSDGSPKSEKAGVEHMLANLTDMLTKITDALGLSTPADGMVPGADEGGMVPPPGPEGDGTGEDPAMGKKPGVGSDNKMHTVHERSLKPGEAPPGTTPVGSPAFASVQVDDDHPWKAAIEAGVKEIEVESEIGDTPIATVAAELKGLAEPYGYIVTDLAPSGAGTSRTASARIVRTR
jgi:hypothetical protein